MYFQEVSHLPQDFVTILGDSVTDFGKFVAIFGKSVANCESLCLTGNRALEEKMRRYYACTTCEYEFALHSHVGDRSLGLRIIFANDTGCTSSIPPSESQVSSQRLSAVMLRELRGISETSGDVQEHAVCAHHFCSCTMFPRRTPPQVYQTSFQARDQEITFSNKLQRKPGSPN